MVKFNQSFLALVTVALGATSSAAIAIADVPIDVGGTIYNFNYVSGSYNALSSTYFNTTYMPWWTGTNDHTSADTFALALGNAGNYVLGQPNSNPNNIPGYPNAAPFFAFDDHGGFYNHVVYQINNGAPAVQVTTSSPGPLSQSFYYAVATVSSAAVPEIDGALIPQVGLLLAGLFIILGRRKENTESLLAV